MYGVFYFIRVRDFMFYVSGLSLLCRDYLLLEIGFWLFYGWFLVKAIWSVFYALCRVNGWFRGLFIWLCMEVVIGSKRLPGFCRRVRGAGCRLAADRRGCRLRGGEEKGAVLQGDGIVGEVAVYALQAFGWRRCRRR